MSRFVEFNFHDFTSESPDTMSQSICICCLAKHSTLIPLNNCTHASFIDNLLKYKMELTNIHVCVTCHTILKNFAVFKQQLEENVMMLIEQSHKLQNKPVKPKLQRSQLQICSTINSQPIDLEIVQPNQTEQDLEIETEIKVEHDSWSDLDTNIPLSEIKKAKKKQKKKEVKKKTGGKRTSLQKKYEGVLRTVILTDEEMLQERSAEAKREGYLKLPFKCEKCISGFDHETTLKDHMEKRHQKKADSFECDICKSVLSTKTSFDEHKKRHFRRHECIACGKRYNNIYSVLKHYNELHGKIDTQFSCDLCDFVTESHRSYRYHKDKHRTAKVECEKCGNTFVNKTGLRVHMYTIHGECARAYACTVCGKRYRARSGLAAHAAAHAPAAAPAAYCAPCCAAFRTAHGLHHHLRTHSRHVQPNDLKFNCEECGAKFLTRSLLREHVDWVHLNKTQHECSKCAKVFKNASSLKKHIEFVHEKKRPPRNKICDHCGRGFTTLSILQSHIRTHTGERPLRCARCPAAFAHSAARYTHTKLLHAHRAH